MFGVLVNLLERHYMLIDSHCHLNRLDLSHYDGELTRALDAAELLGVGRFLTVSVVPSDFAPLIEMARRDSRICVAIGVHPNEPLALEEELSTPDLIEAASDPCVVGVGETGLDYYRVEDELARLHQQLRFRRHIRAARQLNKPLIIHTRQAAEDTLLILEEEKANSVAGVMHCFTESWEVATRAMDLGFYISFSGIVTFHNAKALQEVAVRVPLERILIETDSPYLAPVPHRGKSNEPAWVSYVASALAELRGERHDLIARQTTENFERLFGRAC